VFNQYLKPISFEDEDKSDWHTMEPYEKLDRGKTCYLTRKQLEAYGISINAEYITLIAGSIRETLKLVITEDEGSKNELCLSEDVKSLLFIPPESLLKVKRLNDHTLELGPLVGVFINSKKIAALSEGKTDRAYEIFNDAINSMHGLCCFFSVGDIDWEKRLVKAMLIRNKCWISNIMPLPKVIYDRCFGEYGRNRGMEFRKRLGSDYHVINSIPKLGKWETIEALSKNPNLIDFIPETVLYHSHVDAENALNGFKAVYLKPDKLYKGKGIYKLSRNMDYGYKLELRTENENKEIHLSDLGGLDEILSLYSTKGGGYIIQGNS